MTDRVCYCQYLFYIPSDGGGAEKVSINIANILKRKGLDVRVVFIKGTTKSVVKYLSSDISYDIINANNHLSRYYGILKFIHKYRPRMVFSSLTAISIVLILSKLLFRNLTVVTRQCFMPYRGSRIVNTSIKYLFKYADVNIAQTVEMKQSMMQYYKLKENKVIVINNPLDLKDIKDKIRGAHRIDSNRYRFIAIGRIEPIKGFDTLIRAFAKVHVWHPEATLKIIGNATCKSYLQSLHDLAKQLNVTKNIEILGYTDNPYKELLGANCFVLSSVAEGLPNVLLEAMYLNLPVAATTCIPFISQVIIEGQNGYTSPVGNVDALAVAMEKATMLYDSVENAVYNENAEQHLVDFFKQIV